MPQHDYDIANGSGAAFRADLNAVLAAIASTNKGPTPPSTPQAGMLWVEDDNPSATQWTVRMYDGADWIALGVLNAATNSFAPANALLTTGVPAGSASAPSIAPTGDSNTGIFFPAADTIAFSEGGVEALRLDSSGNATFAGTAAMSSSFLRNRIINGDMRIDQRNAGAAVTVNTGNQTFSVDRWWGQGTASSGVFTMQRSTVAPAGFTNSLAITVTTPDSSLAASDLYDIAQFIEGFNVADFNFGTASAVTFALSFWVRSSVTGTYGGALGNNAGNRSYPFTYSVSAANTWEYKTVVIAGDTAGTWTTDNTAGLRVYFGLGLGSNWSGTAGAWAGSFLISATGATNLMATNGATFYLTGVQLEVGTAATPFERRQFGTELMLCQRYYEVGSIKIYVANASQVSGSSNFKATKRASPTMSFGTAANRSFVPGSTEWAEPESFGVFRAGSEIAATFTAAAEL